MSAFPPPDPPQQPQQSYYYSPQSPPAQQSDSGCLKFGIAGCVGGLAMIGIAVIALVFLVFNSMKGNRPYTESLSRARADQRVIEDLGAPVKPGMFVSGTIKGGIDGSADLNYSLSGPKSDGSMHVVATRSRGVWTYKTMLVHTAKRDIDLLSP